MKKVFLITIMIISFATISNAQYSSCVRTGNVEATILSNGYADIHLDNANNYMVDVDWTLYGVKDGERVFLNSSSTYVGANDTKRIETDMSYDEYSKYDRFSIKITASKCD